jgi:hypothetical protein
MAKVEIGVEKGFSEASLHTRRGTTAGKQKKITLKM